MIIIDERVRFERVVFVDKLCVGRQGNRSENDFLSKLYRVHLRDCQGYRVTVILVSSANEVKTKFEMNITLNDHRV